MNQFIQIFESPIHKSVSETDIKRNGAELKIQRTYVLPKLDWLYRITQSPWCSFLFLVFAPIILLLFHCSFISNTGIVIAIGVTAALNALFALARMDRALIRCLVRKFDWAYLCFVMLNFIVWSCWSEEWVHLNGIGTILYLLIITPISLVVLHLDSVPLYPSIIKLLMLAAGLLIVLRFLLIANFFTTPIYHEIYIPGLLTTNTYILGSLAAGELVLYLLQHIWLNLVNINDWKSMTILKMPLLLINDTLLHEQIQQNSTILPLWHGSPVQLYYTLQLTTQMDGYQAVCNSTNSYFHHSVGRRKSEPVLIVSKYNFAPWKSKYVVVNRHQACQVKTNFQHSTNCLLELNIPFEPILNFTLVKNLKITRYIAFNGLIFTVIAWLLLHIAISMHVWVLINTILCISIYTCSELYCFDKVIAAYLIQNFEVIVYLYQMTRVFITSVYIFDVNWLWLSLLSVWTILTLQTIFLDAAVAYSQKMKTTISLLSVITSFILLFTSRPTIPSFLHCMFVFALIRLIIFQLKYTLHSLLRPYHCFVMSVPLSYKVGEL